MLQGNRSHLIQKARMILNSCFKVLGSETTVHVQTVTWARVVS